jgi:hypothetical protein
MTSSGGAGVPTAVPTTPQAVHGPGAPIGPAHEEGEVVRRAIAGGGKRKKTAEMRW